MSHINKIAAFLQSNSTSPNRPSPNHQPTRKAALLYKNNIHKASFTNEFKPIYRPDNRRRNYTQNSKFIGKSAATLDTHNKMQDKKYVRRTLNPNNNMSGRRSLEFQRLNYQQQDKLLLLRQEKLGRLKNSYNMKNRLSTQVKAINGEASRARFNSIDALVKKQSSEILRKDSKDKYFFNKRQDFHYVSRINEREANKMQKYFDFCQQASMKQQENSQLKEEQSNMPQVIKHDHIISKVKSVKKFAQTPPLVPITFHHIDKKQQINPNHLTLDWLKDHYEPHLQVFNEISYEAFTSKILQNKGMYIGQLKLENGVPQGLGFIFYHNGKIYQGHLKNGQKEGFGYELYPDRSYYLGHFVCGKREGKGKFEWSNGEVYDGEWKNNKKEGSGIWKGPNNLSYVGEWHHDVIQGFGVLVEGGVRYEGEFKNFMKSGNGTLRFQNGEIYTGTFKQNIPNGTGDYYWLNKDHYHGQFVNGKRHGQGVLRYSNGGVYRGLFQNDKKSGKGEEYYQDKLYYEGEFQNELRHGWGTLYCDGAILFQGYWLNNAAVDQKKGKIETIIEEQQSNFDKQSKKSITNKYGSNVSLLRNKNLLKKQNNLISKSSKPHEQQGAGHMKPFRRACNCQRHRQRPPFVV